MINDINDIDIDDINDVNVTRIYIYLMRNNIDNYDNKVYFFNNENGLWENNKDMFIRSVSNMQDQLKFIDKYSKNGYIIDYSGVRKKWIIYKLLASQLIDKGDIRDKIQSTSYGKILFADGIYDTITNTFTQGFNRNIVFSDRINDKFNIDLVPQ